MIDKKKLLEDKPIVASIATTTRDFVKMLSQTDETNERANLSSHMFDNAEDKLVAKWMLNELEIYMDLFNDNLQEHLAKIFINMFNVEANDEVLKLSERYMNSILRLNLK